MICVLFPSQCDNEVSAREMCVCSSKRETVRVAVSRVLSVCFSVCCECVPDSAADGYLSARALLI